MRSLKSRIVRSVLQRFCDPRSISCRIGPSRLISNSCGSSFFKRMDAKQISDGTRQSLFDGHSQVNYIRPYHKIFVGNLLLDDTKESVRDYFSQYGLVLSVNIVRNSKTMESEGRGCVLFADKETLGKVLNSQPHLISNQPVSVQPVLDIRFLVTELSPSSTDQSLQAYFSRFGKIYNCRVKRDPTKGINCGFIHFSDQNEINEGLASNVHVIDGKQVEVERMVPEELTLFVGNLSPTTTEQSLHAFYSQFGSLLQSKVKRERLTGQSRCFGYVSFSSQQELDSAMRSVPHIIDGKDVKIDYNTREFTLFVANLPFNMSEDRLRNYFEQFGPVYRCKVARDYQTSKLLDFGWVIFSSIKGLNGALSARPHLIDGTRIDARACEARYKNTSLFVGGLSPGTTDQMLHDVFSNFGPLVTFEVKLDPMTGQSRGFGYVAYSSANEVSKALLGGPHVIDGRVVRVMLKNASAVSLTYGAKKGY